MLLSISASSQFRINANIAADYFYTPYDYGYKNPASLVVGADINKNIFVGGGFDISQPMYDKYNHTALFVEAKGMLDQQNVSPFINTRFGTGWENFYKIHGYYVSPGIGIIQHLDNKSFQFTFAYKHHTHSELKWVNGFEMRFGIIL
jgi:hypothetical protein